MPAVSPTSLTTFLTCPRQYEAKYITKEVVFQETAHTRFGTAVHAALEARIKDGTPLPPSLASLEKGLTRITDLPYKINAKIYAETKMAIDADGKPCDFFAPTARLRCIADLVIDAGHTVLVVDWKTGKKRDHQIQHSILQLCADAAYPDAQRVGSVFVYLYAGSSEMQYLPEEGVWASSAINDLREDLFKLDHAYRTNHFPPKPSGLCKRWCDVLSCEYNGRRT